MGRVSKEYRFYSVPTHSTVAVNSAAVQVLSANQSRTYALVCNDSSNDVYISLGSTATMNAGILLTANGGNYEMSGAFGNLYDGKITGIAGSDANNVLVTEGWGR